ncbi:MAG: glycosyltransferase family 4 protein [Planctomycetaceae bacterium]|nr:glycosyltransferase family 4 protein [Planctomycetaceae bacterium]
MSRAMRMASTVVALDQLTEAAIRRHLPDIRLARIPNCIIPDELPPTRETGNGTCTVMYLGWVLPTKGMDELVEAWAKLNPNDWRLRIVGPGNPAYREQLLNRHRPNSVEFVEEMGHREAMVALAKADILVLPSYTEGFPNVVLEAMTLGKAIVATRVGAIPEMLADGRGLLVSPRSAADLAAAIAHLLHDGDLRFSLGLRAQNYALKEYGINTVFEQLMKEWRRAARMES